MKKYLALDWNLGIASGELISSMLLSFFAITIIGMVKNKFKGNKIMKAGLISASILLSTMIGWGIGSLVESMGYGLSLMMPGNAIFGSIYYNEFHAIWMILGAQLIGAIIGWGLSLVSSYVSKTPLIETEDLLPSNIDIPRFIAKETLFQLILGVLVLASFPLQQSITSYDSGKLITQLSFSIGMFALLASSSGSGFFMFSPFIAIPVVIEGLFRKKTSHKHLTMFAIAATINITMFIGMGYIGYAFENKHGRG